MSIKKITNRLEERFVDYWSESKDKDCIWWLGEWWSWDRLNNLALDCEGKLRAAGFKKGQRIAMIMPNSPMVFAISIAVWRLGGAVAPLNVRTGIPNLVDTVRILDVNAVFIYEDKLEHAIDFKKLLTTPVLPASTDKPLQEVVMRQGAIETEDLAVIFSTSGTSGNPKAVSCTHTNIMSNIDDAVEAAPSLITKDTVFLNVLPNFHTLGFNTTGLMAVLNGVKQVVLPSFVPVENTIKAIEAGGVNTIIAVPTLMGFLLGYLAAKNEKLTGVRTIISGGDKLNLDLDRRAQEYMGVGILEGYGLTECSPIVSFNSSYESRKLGTVGRKFKSFEIQIRDRDGKVIDLHEEGVLWLRGPSVVSEYYRDEKSTKERFDDDGWFNSGDVVRIDEDGFINIVDRATDIIIVTGFNVYPQEVEAILCSHPAVKDAVVVGEKNKVAGEIAKAFIILNEGMAATPKELMLYCKERMAHYKVPRKIAIVTEYPVSPAGKVLRRELRKINIAR
ncbi:MAG: AMP-binding protein [Synergistaceae bacterium]|jgi:long-chain acyl-CoA synthetase